MTRIVRAGDLIGMPVITLDEARTIGEVRDVLFDPAESAFVGFTVRGRGLLSPPMIGLLPAAAIASTGQDAVMISSAEDIVRERDAIREQISERREVPGNDVVTESGEPLGTVSDVVLELGEGAAGVVGYCVTLDNGRELVVPAPENAPDWADAIVVPDEIVRQATEGLIGFSRLLEQSRRAGPMAAIEGGP